MSLASFILRSPTGRSPLEACDVARPSSPSTRLAKPNRARLCPLRIAPAPGRHVCYPGWRLPARCTHRDAACSCGTRALLRAPSSFCLGDIHTYLRNTDILQLLTLAPVSLAPPCRHPAAACTAVELSSRLVELVASALTCSSEDVRRLASCLLSSIVSTPPPSRFLQTGRQGSPADSRAYRRAITTSPSCSAAVRERLLHLHRASYSTHPIHARTHRARNRRSPQPHRRRRAPHRPQRWTRARCATQAVDIGLACQVAGCNAGRVASELITAALDSPGCHGRVWHDQSSSVEHTW